MMKEIRFYSEMPLVQRDYERFGFEIFLSRGFKVSFLDMTRILHPHYLENYQPPNLSPYFNIAIAKNRDDVLNFVQKNKRAFGIVLLGYNDKTKFLYEAFRKYNIQYAQYESFSLPRRSETFEDQLLKLLKRAREFHFILILKSILGTLQSKLKLITTEFNKCFDGVQPPRYSLRTAREYRQCGPRLGKNSEIIWAHSLDYDLYLRHRKQPGLDTGPPYCVFLDEYFPFHPDFLTDAYRRSIPSIQPECYYAGLNRVFGFIEDRTNLSVVIAAHPRARYDQTLKQYFPGCRVEQFKTIELVSTAKFVLAHESRSINFAVMFQKPVIFLTSDDIEKIGYGSVISDFARSLGKEPINMDHEIECDLDKQCVIDQARYREYFLNYIKIPGTPEKPFWEIVADKIERDPFWHSDGVSPKSSGWLASWRALWRPY